MSPLPRLHFPLVHLAKTALRAGDFEHALRLIDRAVDVAFETLGPAHPLLCDVLLDRACLVRTFNAHSLNCPRERVLRALADTVRADAIASFAPALPRERSANQLADRSGKKSTATSAALTTPQHHREQLPMRVRQVTALAWRVALSAQARLPTKGLGRALTLEASSLVADDNRHPTEDRLAVQPGSSLWLQLPNERWLALSAALSAAAIEGLVFPLVAPPSPDLVFGQAQDSHTAANRKELARAAEALAFRHGARRQASAAADAQWASAIVAFANCEWTAVLDGVQRERRTLLPHDRDRRDRLSILSALCRAHLVAERLHSLRRTRGQPESLQAAKDNALRLLDNASQSAVNAPSHLTAFTPIIERRLRVLAAEASASLRLTPGASRPDEAAAERALRRGTHLLEHLVAAVPMEAPILAHLRLRLARLWRRHRRSREAVVLMLTVFRSPRVFRDRAAVALEIGATLAGVGRRHQRASVHFLSLALQSKTPSVRATAAHNLGLVVHALDDTALARSPDAPTAAALLRLAVHHRLRAALSGNRARVRAIGRSLHALGCILDDSCEQDGRLANFEAAIAAYQRALFAFQRADDQGSARQVMRDLAALLEATGRSEAAERLRRRANALPSSGQLPRAKLDPSKEKAPLLVE